MKLRPQTIMSVNISGNWRSSVESHTPLIWIPNSRGTAVGGTQSDTPEKPQNSASLREKAFKTQHAPRVRDGRIVPVRGDLLSGPSRPASKKQLASRGGGGGGGVTPLPWRHAADPALLGEREPTSAEN